MCWDYWEEENNEDKEKEEKDGLDAICFVILLHDVCILSAFCILVPDEDHVLGVLSLLYHNKGLQLRRIWIVRFVVVIESGSALLYLLGDDYTEFALGLIENNTLGKDGEQY